MFILFILTVLYIYIYIYIKQHFDMYATSCLLIRLCLFAKHTYFTRSRYEMECCLSTAAGLLRHTGQEITVDAHPHSCPRRSPACPCTLTTGQEIDSGTGEVTCLRPVDRTSSECSISRPLGLAIYLFAVTSLETSSRLLRFYV